MPQNSRSCCKPEDVPPAQVLCCSFFCNLGLKKFLERHIDIFQVGRDHPYNPNVSLKQKWFHFAPPRPAPVNTAASQSGGGSGSNDNSPDELTRNGSSGNLQAMQNGGNGDGNRRKLQRRRTRTRRTNSGASGGASVAAAQAVRGSLLADPHQQQLQHPSSPAHMPAASSVVPHPRATVTPIIALDCEMVGIGPSGFSSMLARISIVNFNGEVLYDKFVLPTDTVTDYRTHTSGILAHHLEGGTEFRQVQREVSQIIKHRVMVGHGLINDLQALCISIPPQQLRDTALFKKFCPHRPLGLKQLVQQHLSMQPEFAHFQEYGMAHNPVVDARAALALYKLVQGEWENAVAQETRSQQLGAHHSQSQPALINAMGAANSRDMQSPYQSAALLPGMNLHSPQQNAFDKSAAHMVAYQQIRDAQQQQQQILIQQSNAIAQLQQNQRVEPRGNVQVVSRQYQGNGAPLHYTNIQSPQHQQQHSSAHHYSYMNSQLIYSS